MPDTTCTTLHTFATIPYILDGSEAKMMKNSDVKTRSWSNFWGACFIEDSLGETSKILRASTYFRDKVVDLDHSFSELTEISSSSIKDV